MTTSPDSAIDAYLAGQREAQTRFLAELVRLPTDNPPGDCAAAGERAAQLLEALGFVVERHPVPVETVHAHGMQSIVNLVVRERFGDGPTIALNAHGDVVPPGAGWSTDPYGAEIRDGVMYGRGVAVSKSDFATYAFALLALRQSGRGLGGSVELHFTYDEEAGGESGPAWLLAQGISKPDFAIAAGFSYGITIAHNGCLHLEVEVIGRSAHAAMPETGIDALEATAGILADLYALRRTYAATVSGHDGIGSPKLTVGLIHGGVNTNVVPDRIVLRLDRRIIPEENPAQVETELIAAIQASAARHAGIRCDVRRILLASPFVPVPGQERLVEVLQRHGEPIMGQPLLVHSVPLYTDARHYSSRGIPTVLYGAGPRTLLEANGHRADEKLVLDDLYKATRVVAAALADLLGGGA